MSVDRLRRVAASGVVVPSSLCTSCSRAPSFDILGSFFPAWLLCVAASLVVTLAVRWLLLQLHIVVAYPVLTYPSLTALFTFALWLAFFR
jgi:YtcA family